MITKCSDIIKYMEMIAPPDLAEDYDNVGLLVWMKNKDVKSVLICLDVSESNVDYAVNKGCDMIISHHPVIFNRLSRINTDTSKGRIICKLIKNDISVFAAHTNFDIADAGLNQILAEKLELLEIEGLNHYEKNRLYKLAVYVPSEHAEDVRKAISEAGGGWIGNYSDCTFRTEGTGTFKPLEKSNPYIGNKDALEQVREFKIETIVKASNLKNVITAMLEAHPYEEVAYDLYKLENENRSYSLGKTGCLQKPASLGEFTNHVKTVLGTDHVRIIGNTDTEVKKVAVFCGSFDGDWSGYKRTGADVIVTGDVKYHQAFEALEMGICMIDAGHFATEKIFVENVSGKLRNEFPDVEFLASNMENDPFKYY